ncbi:MAG: hypothetical protein WD877_03095 [Candidatus Saccharimonadales bacterium]
MNLEEPRQTIRELSEGKPNIIRLPAEPTPEDLRAINAVISQGNFFTRAQLRHLLKPKDPFPEYLTPDDQFYYARGYEQLDYKYGEPPMLMARVKDVLQVVRYNAGFIDARHTSFPAVRLSEVHKIQDHGLAPLQDNFNSHILVPFSQFGGELKLY